MAENKEDVETLLALMFTNLDTIEYKEATALLGIVAIPSLPAHTVL